MDISTTECAIEMIKYCDEQIAKWKPRITANSKIIVEFTIQMFKLEKLLLASILKKSKPEIFPIIFTKYDETTGDFLEYIREGVIKGILPETHYIAVADDRMERREILKELTETYIEEQ